jgi:PAT family beta-lactamase induction signal transducer AmpG
VVAFAGATQDIAVDAYRIEIAPVADQGALVAVYSLGYRVALILAGAFALGFADHMPWWQVYLIMAVAMLVPIGANLRAREPEDSAASAAPGRDDARDVRRLLRRLLPPLRRRAVAVGAAVHPAVQDPEQALVGGIMSPFYLDMGFTKTTIGVVTKFYGVWVGIAGVVRPAACWWRAYNARKSLLVAMVITALCNLLYLLLIAHPGKCWC